MNLSYPFPADFGNVTPLRRIPVLITSSGETLFEAAVIAEYLEDHFPETPVLPGTPRARSHPPAGARDGTRRARTDDEALHPVEQTRA